MPVYEVGKSYDVPHVFASWPPLAEHGIRWWPVWLPLHDDREGLNVRTRHYHVDWRFLDCEADESLVFRWVISQGKRKTPLPVEDRAARCIRQYGFPPEADAIEREVAPVMPEDTRLDISRMICPHKGADLSTVPHDGGEIRCPLHGLRFCAKTGRLKSCRTPALPR